MSELLVYLLLFFLAGLAFALVVYGLFRLLQRLGFIGGASGQFMSGFVLVAGLGSGTYSLTYPELVDRIGRTVGPVELTGGMTSQKTANLDPELAKAWVQAHEIRVTPSRTDTVATVEYIWGAPSIVSTMPAETAAFLSYTGPGDIKVSGVPPCRDAMPGIRVGEVASCAPTVRDIRSIGYAWNIATSEPAELALQIRLGAAAVGGKFHAERCADNGMDVVCTAYGDPTDLFAGAGDVIALNYAGERLEAGGQRPVAASADGMVTLDAGKGLVSLKLPVTYPSGLSARQWQFLTIGGSIIGVLFGSGAIFAFLDWQGKRRKPSQPARPMPAAAPIPPPKKSAGGKTKQPGRK